MDAKKARKSTKLCGRRKNGGKRWGSIFPKLFFTDHPRSHLQPISLMEPGTKIPHLSQPYGATPRNADAYVGFCCRRSSSRRFLNWLLAELDSSDVRCFASNRSSCPDAVSHLAARKAMEEAAVGVVLITPGSFANPYSMEEIDVFVKRNNLLPIYLGLEVEECNVQTIIASRGEAWRDYGGSEEEWKRAIDGLCSLECRLDLDTWNWRDRVAEAVAFVGRRLRRKEVVEKQKEWKEMEAEEFPFAPSGRRFFGREEELAKLEMMLFGDSQTLGHEECCGWKREDHSEAMGDSRGLACVSGGHGVGKTELVLEFARRFSRRYKMLLWVRGGARYLRQSFASLLPLLGIDPEEGGGVGKSEEEAINFRELEEKILERLRRELSKGIPFLVVVDALESENDWWDGRSIAEFLPESGGATHAIVSTRLPQVKNMELLRLLPLPASKAMRLMRWGLGDLPLEETNALEIIMERLGRITLAISIVGAILVEIPIRPTKLLDIVSRIPERRMEWNRKDDPILESNPFLLQLLDLCILVLNIADGQERLASRMVLASGWFAPSSVPIPLLYLAAIRIPRTHRRRFWRCVWKSRSFAAKSKPEAESNLVALQMARRCAGEGRIQFHDTVRLYARGRGEGDLAAPTMSAVVRAIDLKGSVPHHSEHLWAACFLVFKFGAEPPRVHLKVTELMSFVKRVVIPLASEASRFFCHYKASIALLGQATKTLEALGEPYASEVQKELERTSSCCEAAADRRYGVLDPIYQEFALLRATLLEMRAMIMLKGGCYDVAQQLSKNAIIIREVFHGQEHQDMVSIRETMEKALGSSR